MKYTDQHLLQAAERSRGVRFSKAEIDQAIDEMHRTRQTISSVSREGFGIGLTQNRFGTQFASAYVGDLWVGLLAIAGDGSGIVQVNLPPPVLMAVGTEFHDRAKAIAAQESILRASQADDDAPGLEDHDDDIGELRDDLRQAGRLEVHKRGLHLTDRAMSILAAGGSASARANAILDRYQAILDSPHDQELIASIVELEAIERRLAPLAKALQEPRAV